MLGSQGDAGQFPHPRAHIIDFMVAILNPKKDENHPRPGLRQPPDFLVSSYKHILEANTDAGGQQHPDARRQGQAGGQFQGL